MGVFAGSLFFLSLVFWEKSFDVFFLIFWDGYGLDSSWTGGVKGTFRGFFCITFFSFFLSTTDLFLVFCILDSLHR